ncbi:MAG TPA: DNA translocase FtsK [bacterium]|nr:DNA translocase FtsK [bacterium]HRQ69207.1 DNA translocase FtsK [bacterium]
MSQKKNDAVKKKKKGSGEGSSEKKLIIIEISAAFVFLSAIFLWFSLANFSAKSVRSGFFTGTLGYDAAHSLINLFGIVSFYIPLLLALTILCFIKRGFIRHVILNYLNFFVLLPLFWMISGYFRFYGIKNENFLGKLIYENIFHLYLGKTGFILLTTCWMIIFSIFSFNVSYFFIFRKMVWFWSRFFEKVKETKLIDRDDPGQDDIDENDGVEEELTENSDDRKEFSFEPPPVPEKIEEKIEKVVEEKKITKRKDDISVSIAEQDGTGLERKTVRSHPDYSGYKFPPLDLLKGEEKVKAENDREKKVRERALLLERKLLEHRLKVAVQGATVGPVVTMYEVELGEGVRVNQVMAMETDLGVAVGGRKIRVVSSLPGKPYIGIEVPNDDRLMIRLKTILRSDMFVKQSKTGLPIALGQDVSGKPFAANLVKMPHLLVAGTTGSGKSVGINTFIVSLLFSLKPDEVKFIMVDPKGNEFNIYEGIPHLLLPVVVDSKKAAKALQWAVNEMEERFHRLAENMVRDIEAYNEKVDNINKNLANVEHHMKKMPYIVVVIDEFADLMMVAGKDVEIAVSRIAQKARAVGIHLIIATQRPTRDVVTGLIKGNLPVRIAFRVASALDSRTILDSNGAEMLLGNGDMLYIPPGSSEAERVHGAFVGTDEIKKIVKFIKDQVGDDVATDDSILGSSPIDFLEDEGEGGYGGENEKDPMYDEILAYVLSTGKCSASMLQRKFKIGYNRAARAVEVLEAQGIVSPADGAKPRTVINPKEG